MNTQRRIFRGRGGPTDRRLPKHNARRRCTPGQQPHKPSTNKYLDDDARNEAGDADCEDVQNIDSTEFVDSPDDATDDAGLVDSEMSLEANVLLEATSSAPNEETSLPGADRISDENTNPCVKEIQHLKKRVRNIRETMQLSNSISNPQTYQNNVLNAVTNCVNEWRSIVTHYPPAPEDSKGEESGIFYLCNEIRKPAALAVFEMIQQAVQSGPLAGAKPGYFKRCGGEVAKVAESFLEEVIPHAPTLVPLMGFTSKQMDAMESWRKNAQKAVLENKPPSRAASRNQEGKGTGKKAKKKIKA